MSYKEFKRRLNKSRYVFVEPMHGKCVKITKREANYWMRRMLHYNQVPTVEFSDISTFIGGIGGEEVTL